MGGGVGKEKKHHPLCWHFVWSCLRRDKGGDGDVALAEWAVWRPAFLATTWYLPYNMAEVLIIQIQ